MIFITVKFPVHEDKVEQWPSIVAEFTAATRAEPGNLFFEWSKSLEEPNVYVLVEGFRDAAAGGEHVNSDHFKKGVAVMADAVTAKPAIVSVEAPGDGWSEMGEITPTNPA
jgi:quinol monooxygenase YgiN